MAGRSDHKIVISDRKTCSDANVGIAGNACLKRMTSPSNASDAAVIAAFTGIPALLDQAPALILRGRTLDCECRLGPMDQPFHASIRAGRIIAFDMPWHGKSNPRASWTGEEYRLTTARYTRTIRAFCKALALEKPVVIGRSIGGRIVLNLAIEHAAEFRALIGLEAADFQEPWYDTGWLHRPDVHGGEVCAALVSGLIAPQSPETSRRETLWCYMQSGPGVFKGDLYFYRVDGDLRGRVEGIDTGACPLYLLTGEYDFSCTPEDTRRTAAAIKGASVTIMEQLGHFPMSENPEQFRRYIAPVLSQILGQTTFDKQGEHV
jgi:pimeloyl-ACP methyl ester carboxylesterase